jgi:hypothetical protein
LFFARRLSFVRKGTRQGIVPKQAMGHKLLICYHMFRLVKQKLKDFFKF